MNNNTNQWSSSQNNFDYLAYSFTSHICHIRRSVGRWRKGKVRYNFDELCLEKVSFEILLGFVLVYYSCSYSTMFYKFVSLLPSVTNSVLNNIKTDKTIHRLCHMEIL